MPIFKTNQTLWTPQRISTSLWFDAADTSTITVVSGAVSEWGDKSGKGGHWEQSDPNRQPTYDGVLGGVTVPKLNRDRYFQGPYLNYSEHFWLAVVSPSNVSENDFLGSNAATSSHAFTMFYANRLRGHTWANSSGDRFNLDSNSTVTAGATYLAGQFQQGSTFGIMLNGVVETLEIALSGTTGVQTFQNGRSTMQSTTLIAEVVLLEPGWTYIDRQKLEGYLAHKWGLTTKLPPEHPFKNYPPRGL